MISYLSKFNNLPKELREKISSPEAMKFISELEKRYAVSLAATVMQVMIKDIFLDDLSSHFVREFDFDKHRANELARELKEKVFVRAAEYLGIASVPPKPAPAAKSLAPLSLVAQSSISKPVTQSAPTEDKQLDKWMQDRKADTATVASSFFFSPEDEAEVQKLARKVAAFTKEKPKAEAKSQELDRIMKEAGVSFSSEDLNNRFRQVLKTYIHGVRNRIDTKQTLIKSIGVGGLGIENQLADKILKAANQYRNEPEQEKMKAPAKILIPEDKVEVSGAKTVSPAGVSVAKEAPSGIISPLGEVEYDFNALLNQKEEKKTPLPVVQAAKNPLPGTAGPLKREKSTYEENEKEEENQNEKNELIDLSKIEKLRDEASEEDIARGLRHQTASSQRNKMDSNINIVQARANAGKEGKVKMEDVKYVPKLTGPIDELREMSLVNFRRLSSNPREAAARIKEKIGFLEEESFSKKFEGIKAWRQSPVNRLYLEMGQDSIIKKKSINDIININRQAKKNVLTEHEFKAVMDLNKDLRF